MVISLLQIHKTHVDYHAKLQRSVPDMEKKKKVVRSEGGGHHQSFSATGGGIHCKEYVFEK